jgi:DNA polymerase-3 subunit beta
VSKLIDGTFPDYERVIPSEDQCEHTVTLDRDSFAAAIKAACAISGERSSPVKVTASSELGTVTVSASNPETGSQACEEVRTCYGCSVDIEVGYQARYLLDILARLKAALCSNGRDLSTHAASWTAQTRITLSVLMPMRI